MAPINRSIGFYLSRFASAAIALCISTLWSSASAQPREYVVLQVTTAQEGLSQISPRINNKGEIVYMESDSQFARIYSTRRGNLTGPIPHAQTADTPISNLRFPDINNSGEVVYAALPPGPAGLTIFSTDRGEIGPGNLPRISNSGLIATTVNEQLPLAIYLRNGTLVPVAVDENVALFRHPVNLSPSRDLTYVARDHSGIHQLYSSKRGQVTDFGSQEILFVAANDRGEFVYQQYNIVYSSDGTILWDGAVGFMDMNNAGDIVFMEQVLFEDDRIQLQILLLTQRPKFFLQRDEFSYRSAPPR